METARVFWSGRSQAVRLPKEFRFDVAEVSIRRRGEAVLLEPIPADWSWLESVIAPVDPDFEKSALETVPPQDRRDLDIFK